MQKKIKSALISVFYKDGLEPLLQTLASQGVTIYSTGGTQKFIEEQGVSVARVEDLTSYPSIFGGRVKTLHPKVFGGILHRRNLENDLKEAKKYEIPEIDLVIVDLYPFEETAKSGASEDEIIEKIDIGGIALIRAAAKNYNDVVIISDKKEYPLLNKILREQNGSTNLETRRNFATKAFNTSSHYDTAIFNHLNQVGTQGDEPNLAFKQSIKEGRALRYGENPHQKGYFYGDLEALFQQLNGKELSYNNLVDVDAAVALIDDFEDSKNETPAFAILKHTNACGMATAKTVAEAYKKAFAADTLSAFGGVLITNSEVDKAAAEEMNSLFFEVLIAPSFSDAAYDILSKKKNRILLKRKEVEFPHVHYKTLLNGVISQDADKKQETKKDLKTVTKKEPTNEQIEALLFANKLVKHTKSNTIIIAVEGQLLASGVGQTSRVDALRQAIAKAKVFGFDLKGAVIASDAFFPFPDCVEIAAQEGISAVIQPGGSIKDQDSIDMCDKNEMAMVLTGTRHFKH
ncbi:AICAR transformylase/IMP cyclohydrolase PurH [Bernardetia litoralis DSM 6794]|uniref:Bifunctional purine biosynthesis protein PurH n=1 Tax=Bernardetia litoralis (strain ATCC 23117 / DSM 6794 / NBRC 15988 / NCIMB 1366 / Fx l1 / Sio-4) TaxID=880071 RepID=I4AP69_BERLS|nr:bifunctional phosphoribosylaminoimidazolecarboxamide formyltransferase/IMP cyclohydrolase [Bernardetia litoralis]AFM05754.1 AICAR transformylase/IMP cyclohydrolase PurH [Bernardetia litoralis DSM 6794]